MDPIPIRKGEGAAVDVELRCQDVREDPFEEEDVAPVPGEEIPAPVDLGVLGTALAAMQGMLLGVVVPLERTAHRDLVPHVSDRPAQVPELLVRQIVEALPNPSRFLAEVEPPRRVGPAVGILREDR